MSSLRELIGESAIIQALRERITRLLQHRGGARHFPPLLVLGETGTGKGLVARLIHSVGPRADGPFVEVNCAAIPETLLEAELFGFERGAFTDARQAKPGLFQAAHRGTIFLDEIGLLPEGLQAKLLSVLEERTVRRLGSTRSEPVDVWIVTATNEDLAQATRARRFREDLYHRLAVLTLAVPPLRARGQDILLLADHFLARACAEYDLPPKTFAPDARAALGAYAWPGNVRELGNVVERVALLSEAPVVTADLLALPEPAAPERPEPAADLGPEPLERAIGSVERAHLLEALRQTGWNITRAAARLGVSRNTLRYRIEKHALRPERGRTTRTPGVAPAPAVAPGTPAPVPPPAAVVPAASSVRWERRRLTLLHAAPAHPLDSPLHASRAIQTLVEKVQSFGGRVEELSPSGIVAAFGLEPVEDAPRRAAHAAMAMQKAAERARLSDTEAPRLRIGIHVGQFLVGQTSGGPQIDPDAKREGWAVLHVLVAAAEPEATLASDATAPFLDRRFDLAPVPGVTPGGGQAYRLVGRERSGLGVRRRMARFVGRHQDLQLLRSRVAAAMAGHGQAVGIVGEAGIGKSRLLFELRQSLRGENLTWLRGRCLSYGGAIPYFLVLDILRQTLRITESDSQERIGQKIYGALRQTGLDPEEAVPYLLQLFGVREGTERLAVLSDQALKARILETLRNMILSGSRQRPIVYVAEDLHWIDRASEDCVAFLVEHLAGSPVLLLCTYRPGYRPPWVHKSYATQLALGPLAPRDGLELVRSVLGSAHVPEPLAQTILDRAEGNPFFLEELARALGEQGGLRAAVTVPGTIQEVLLARIDRLPHETRRFLQTASVLGREFSPRLLGALWAGEAESHLDDLKRLEFLLEGTRAGEPVYAFKHALTQEVAYEALPPAERQALHAAAGGALERLNPEPSAEAYDRLAYHYAKTEESAKAIEYLTRSAERAARSYAHEETVRALEKAMAHVERLPAEVRDARLLDLLLRQASSLIPLGRFQEILDLLVRHQGALERLKDPRLAGHYYFLLGRTWSFLGQNERVTENARRAIAEAERCGDDATTGKAYSMLAMVAAFSGQARQGIEYGRRAIALLERTDERYWLGDAHWAVGLNHAQTGEFEPALEAEGRAHAIGEAIGDPRLQTFAAWITGIIYTCIGEADAGIAECQRALERAPDPLNRAIATGLLGFAHLEKGEHTRAIPLLERSVQRLGEFHYRPFQGWFSVFLAEAVRRERRLERARDLAMQGLVITRDADFRTGVGWAQQILGRIARDRGALDEAQAHLAAARETFTSIHSRYELGRTHLDLVALAQTRGDREQVVAGLTTAYALFRGLRVPKYVERAARLARELRVALPEDAQSRQPAC